jgi:transglutaminase-like putative cysteine protease
MTATTFGQVRGEAAPERRIPLAPAEGWTTLALVLLLCLTVAWSIDDASWVPAQRGITDFLAWSVALGVLWGFVSAKIGWSRWLAHVLGATFAGLLLPMLVGSHLVTGGGPVEWFQATAAAVVNAYFDLTYRALPLTNQIGHFMLTLAAACWATGQFAGYVTFHHRRPLNAVIVVGVGLVANMSLTIRDQLPFLVLYSLAALFLLIRFHAYDERMLWLRHRIGDAASLGGLYLRGGSVFVAGAVVVALFLTASASSDPLSGMWKGVDQKLIDVGREFQRVFRVGGGATRINAVDFGGTASITGVWTTDNSPVMNIDVTDAGRYYWRAVTYDRFDGRSWTWSQPTETTVDAGAVALADSADDPTHLAARHEVTFTVHELAFDPHAVFSPDTPVSVDVPTRLTTVSDLRGRPGYYSGLTADASTYAVTASAAIDGTKDPQGGLTANKLRVAGTDYPAGVKSLYLSYDAALIGPATRQLMATILVAHPEAKDSPYDLARVITTYLISEGGFVYDADVSDVDCHGNQVVECFAATKRGYCEYYASTLALLLRWNGVPARLAEGFLPGERSASGTELIRKSGSHAWVEVYFPTYGWVPFDPTGGSIGQDVPLPAGPVVSAPPATPRTSLPADDGQDPRRSIRPSGSGSAAGAGGTDQGGPGSGTLVVIGLLLALIVGGLVAIAWQRGPRTASEPDVVWRSVVGLARRLGFAPRPSQTVFEYTAALGQILPSARPDLQIVARAKVEVAYGRGRLGEDRMRGLRDAQRRLRVALLALIFRRRERRERRTRGG